MNIADSPLTTQAVVATGVGSGVANWLSVVPEIVGIAGGLIAATAGIYLILRHHSKRRLNDSERNLIDLQADKLSMENEEMRKRLNL